MNSSQTSEQQFKRHIAFKLRIGQILSGQPNLEADKLKSLTIEGKEVSRVNLIANVTDKFIQDGEKKYASVTMDDASGQIKAKIFGEEIEKLNEINQGDTLLIVGLLRAWNNEVYITPEIMKKKDPRFLLIRKLEVEAEQPKALDKEKVAELKDKILSMVKQSENEGGIAIDKIIMDLKESPDFINKEIKKLLEDGSIYEPRPGKLRYLG
jgi:uncharacterized protein